MTIVAPQQFEDQIDIAVGVDTHTDTAAVIDTTGGSLATNKFPADGPGYRALLVWLCTFGLVTVIGVEGAGAYGAGLANHLADEDVNLVEIDHPDRRTTAPENLRAQLRGLGDSALLKACVAFRPDTTRIADPTRAAKAALQSLARRHRALITEIDDLDALIGPLVEAINPELLELVGVGGGRSLSWSGKREPLSRPWPAYRHLAMSVLLLRHGRT